MRRSELDFHVMEAIFCENHEYRAILRYLNEEPGRWRRFHERGAQAVEVEVALVRLVRDGMVEIVVRDDAAQEFVSCGERVWPAGYPLGDLEFDLTGRGGVRIVNWAG